MAEEVYTIGGRGNDFIVGVLDSYEIIFGDPFTAGADNIAIFYPEYENFPESEGVLSSGQGGDDLMLGGPGLDDIWGDAYIITGNGSGGNDIAYGGKGTDFLFGDCSSLGLKPTDPEFVPGIPRGGDDILIGGNDVDYVVGDAFDMLGHARGGNDAVIGGDGDEGGFNGGVVGDAANSMRNQSIGGNDLAFGGKGDDRIYHFTAVGFQIQQTFGGSGALASKPSMARMRAIVNDTRKREPPEKRNERRRRRHDPRASRMEM